MPKMNIIDAVKNALDSELKRDKNVIVLGEDVGKNGGVFRATDGLFKKYGPKRIIDTPLTEEGILGNAVGLAVYGLKPVVEIQFSGFLAPAFDQIFTHAVRIRTRSRGRFTCPLVVRAPSGGGIRALELHCECPEAYYAHMQGVKVICPGTPYDAKGLLIAAIRDPDPVIFLEPMRIYRAVKQDVPSKSYTVPIGKANVVKKGNDLTIVTWGAMLKYTLETVENNNIDAEVIDLRTISPMDTETIIKSLEKTGRMMIVHEGCKTNGVGAEVSARINEKGLDYLEAPVVRVAGYDTALPFFKRELQYIPDEKRIMNGINKVLNY